MKSLFLLLLVALGLSTASFAGTKKVIVVKTTIVCDHCLQCSSCGQNVNDKVRDLNEGIKNVKINAKEQTITVTYLDNKTTPEKIREAIAAAGFDADNVKASEDGYAKLDGCCKKDNQ